MSSSDHSITPKTNVAIFAAIIGLFCVLFFAIACSATNDSAPIQSITLKPTESVARLAFYEWAKNTNQPYKDETFGEVANDGTYATVRVTAWFRPSAESDWIEQYADIEVRNVGGQWQTRPFMAFQITQAEYQRQQTRYAAAANIAKATQISWQETSVVVNSQTSQARTSTIQAHIVQVEGTRTASTHNTDSAQTRIKEGSATTIANFMDAVRNKDCSKQEAYLTETFKQYLKDRKTDVCQNFGIANDSNYTLIGYEIFDYEFRYKDVEVCINLVLEETSLSGSKQTLNGRRCFYIEFGNLKISGFG